MTDIDIHGLKAAAQKLSLPLSPSWMAGGIRHLNKNVDSDAFWDEPEGGDGFTPGRYEGETMATVLNAVPALIERLERAEKNERGRVVQLRAAHDQFDVSERKRHEWQRAAEDWASRYNDLTAERERLKARLEKLEAVAKAASPFASSNAGGLEARLAQALAALEAP